MHNPEAAEAVRAGKTVVEVKSAAESDEHEEEGAEAGAELPAFYAEAYVPVMAEGSVIGIMEAYVDQSAKRAAFNAKIGGVALALAGIIAVAFGLPALGFTWRTRQKQQSDSRAEFLDPPRRADRSREPRAFHAGPERGDRARLPGRRPYRRHRPLQGGQRHLRSGDRRRDSAPAWRGGCF